MQSRADARETLSFFQQRPVIVYLAGLEPLFMQLMEYQQFQLAFPGGDFLVPAREAPFHTNTSASASTSVEVSRSMECQRVN